MGLDVFIEVTLESEELQVIERHDVGTAIIQKTRIVTDDDGCNVSQRVEVSLDPCNIDNICKRKRISIASHR